MGTELRDHILVFAFEFTFRSSLYHCHILLRLYVFSLACYILAHHIVHIVQGYLVCLCISHYCIIISYLRETAIVLYRIMFV